MHSHFCDHSPSTTQKHGVDERRLHAPSLARATTSGRPPRVTSFWFLTALPMGLMYGVSVRPARVTPPRIYPAGLTVTTGVKKKKKKKKSRLSLTKLGRGGHPGCPVAARAAQRAACRPRPGRGARRRDGLRRPRHRRRAALGRRGGRAGRRVGARRGAALGPRALCARARRRRAALQGGGRRQRRQGTGEAQVRPRALRGRGTHPSNAHTPRGRDPSTSHQPTAASPQRLGYILELWLRLVGHI